MTNLIVKSKAVSEQVHRDGIDVLNFRTALLLSSFKYSWHPSTIACSKVTTPLARKASQAVSLGVSVFIVIVIIAIVGFAFTLDITMNRPSTSSASSLRSEIQPSNSSSFAPTTASVIVPTSVDKSATITQASETTVTVSVQVVIQTSYTDTLQVLIWSNNTSSSTDDISGVKILTNASQVPHVIQFNVTEPSYIFMTEPYGVYNNGTAFDVKYAGNDTSVPLIPDMKAGYLYSAQKVSGLIWIEFTGPGES